MAGLGVAFVSIYAARAELETGRLERVRLRGLWIQRHLHVIHNEARSLKARARAFIDALRRFGKGAPSTAGLASQLESSTPGSRNKAAETTGLRLLPPGAQGHGNLTA
jgi:hypothetical protein